MNKKDLKKKLSELDTDNTANLKLFLGNKQKELNQGCITIWKSNRFNKQLTENEIVERVRIVEKEVKDILIENGYEDEKIHIRLDKENTFQFKEEYQYSIKIYFDLKGDE